MSPEQQPKASNVILFVRESRAQIGARIVQQFEADMIAALAANNIARARQFQADIRSVRAHYGVPGEDVDLC